MRGGCIHASRFALAYAWQGVPANLGRSQKYQIHQILFRPAALQSHPPSDAYFFASLGGLSTITAGFVSNTFLTVFLFLCFLQASGFSKCFSRKAEKSLILQGISCFCVLIYATMEKMEYENGVQEAASSNLVTRTIGESLWDSPFFIFLISCQYSAIMSIKEYRNDRGVHLWILLLLLYLLSFLVSLQL